MEDLERERRKKEREAAELRRKQQLADLRAAAGCRATGEARRIVEHDKEAEQRKKQEEEELEKMKKQEVAQLAGGDRCVVTMGHYCRCLPLVHLNYEFTPFPE